jgi:hypothetical protein
MGGALLPLSVAAVLDVCRAYGESLETFERVLFIEELMWPFVSERENRGQPARLEDQA